MVRTVGHPVLPQQQQKAMDKFPRIFANTAISDINVRQPGGSTEQDLVSLPQIEALVIEECLPPLLASHYHYSMLWWDVVSIREERKHFELA